VPKLDLAGMFTPTISPWEVALRAALIYLGIIALLRLAGRKELGRYSHYDVALLFLVTTAARQSIVGSDQSLTSAFVGLATIIGLDRLLSEITFRWPATDRALSGSTLQLLRDGIPDEDALRRSRLTVEDLRSRLRKHGTDDLQRAAAAYLETNGQITFVLREGRG
jgi:uncharacterized membrane protein YcaP (DUF421 family)